MSVKAVRSIIALAALFVILAAPAARAQTADSDLKVTLAPYAWLTGFNGTIGVRGAQATVNASFADLSKYLNIGAMLHADMLYKDTFGLLGEINYAQLGDQASGKRVSLDGQMGLFLSDIAAFYRIGTMPLGKDGSCPTSLDILAGARIWSLGLNLNTQNALGGSHTVSKQKSWVDPVVGARAQFRITDKWGIDLRGGVGGFGISSAFTWDAMAMLGYTFWDHGTFLVGYRAVGVNHTEGSGKDYFKFDATLNGPVVALAFTF
ncbi:hypothetical protein [Fundidesulfovibrio agrisoli]|uniref:hypothetical protein n=1 Tax=Fundidesulfovibrio agrisoli TaxID=2922717 RepID=UPI001FAC276D|nr:hypothetical protein [Fundidesulfovibrio agrisoli]